MTLRLPQTLAVTQAVFVRIGETTYAVPVASVSGIGRISRERFESGQGGYHYNGEDFSLYNLGTLVGQVAAKAEGQAEIPLLLVRSGDLRAAVAIDRWACRSPRCRVSTAPRSPAKATWW